VSLSISVVLLIMFSDQISKDGVRETLGDQPVFDAWFDRIAEALEEGRQASTAASDRGCGEDEVPAGSFAGREGRQTSE
jgi:hypothetical protein